MKAKPANVTDIKSESPSSPVDVFTSRIHRSVSIAGHVRAERRKSAAASEAVRDSRKLTTVTSKFDALVTETKEQHDALADVALLDRFAQRFGIQCLALLKAAADAGKVEPVTQVAAQG